MTVSVSRGNETLSGWSLFGIDYSIIGTKGHLCLAKALECSAFWILPVSQRDLERREPVLLPEFRMANSFYYSLRCAVECASTQNE